MWSYCEVVQEPLGIRVLIQNEAGGYLTGGPMEWRFTDQRERAAVFDYVRDSVPEQLELIRRAQNKVWKAVRLDPREVYEVCDHCGSRVTAMKVFFDGAEYLCQECRNSSDAAHPDGTKPAP